MHAYYFQRALHHLSSGTNRCMHVEISANVCIHGYKTAVTTHYSSPWVQLKSRTVIRLGDIQNTAGYFLCFGKWTAQKRVGGKKTAQSALALFHLGSQLPVSIKSKRAFCDKATVEGNVMRLNLDCGIISPHSWCSVGIELTKSPLTLPQDSLLSHQSGLITSGQILKCFFLFFFFFYLFVENVCGFCDWLIYYKKSSD